MRRVVTGPVVAVLALVSLLAITTSAVRADPRDFTLVNASNSTIYWAYVSPANSLSWEEDVLGSTVLLPGESIEILFSRTPGAALQCSYDIKVVTGDGREGYLWAVDLCSTTTVTFR